MGGIEHFFAIDKPQLQAAAHRTFVRFELYAQQIAPYVPKKCNHRANILKLQAQGFNGVYRFVSKSIDTFAA